MSTVRLPTTTAYVDERLAPPTSPLLRLLLLAGESGGRMS